MFLFHFTKKYPRLKKIKPVEHFTFSTYFLTHTYLYYQRYNQYLRLQHGKIGFYEVSFYKLSVIGLKQRVRQTHI